MRRVFILLITVCTAHFGQGQGLEKDSSSLWLKLDFSNAVNPVDGSLLASVEYRSSPRFSFTQEVGYIFNYDREVKVRGGWKIREELRVYSQPFDNGIQPYASVNLALRWLNSKNVTYIVGTGCDDEQLSSSCDFIKQETGALNHYQYAAHLRFGVTKPVSERLSIDVDAGFGVQYLTRSNQSLDDNETVFFTSDIYSYDQTGSKAYLTYNAKLAYRLFVKVKDDQ